MILKVLVQFFEFLLAILMHTFASTNFINHALKLGFKIMEIDNVFRFINFFMSKFLEEMLLIKYHMHELSFDIHVTKQHH